MSKPDDSTSKRKARMNVAMWSIGIIVIAVVFLILAKTVSKPSSSGSGSTSSDAPASSALMTKLSSLSDSLFTTVGAGTANPLPKPISGAPALTQDSKPLVFYAGAEYCPYCAAERWGMVVALLRFGTFSGLGTTHSSSSDVYPNTQTLSFHGATYTSKYLAFAGVEQESNQLQGTSYAPLDSLSASQQSILSTYDAAPYVPKEQAGSIPFIDFGGKFLISGATYAPPVLAGKSLDDIAAALSDPNSDISKGAIGTANAITAVICSLTNNQPANVCSSDMIKGLQAKIAAQ